MIGYILDEVKLLTYSVLLNVSEKTTKSIYCVKEKNLFIIEIYKNYNTF